MLRPTNGLTPVTFCKSVLVEGNTQSNTIPEEELLQTKEKNKTEIVVLTMRVLKQLHISVMNVLICFSFS